MEEQKMEMLVNENQEREAAVQDENNDIFKKVEASHKESKAKLIKEKETKLKVMEKETVCALDKIKEDNKEEEEEMVEEQEREGREAPSCPVCFEPLLPPCHIYQCGTGHLLCGSCR